MIDMVHSEVFGNVKHTVEEVEEILAKARADEEGWNNLEGSGEKLT
jgi:hypothetical protein